MAHKNLDIKNLAFKSWRLLAGLGGGTALLLIVLLFSWRSSQGAPSSVSEPAPATPPPPASGNSLAISPEARAKNPIATAPVRKVRLSADLDLVGSAAYDGDHYAIVGPLVHGRVVAVRVRPGDEVKAGQVLAEIESADVGQAQAAYIAASARSRVSQANAKRERTLAEQRISSGREKELAEAQAAADQADQRAAEQRLLALGLTQDEIASLDGGGRRAGRVSLRSPIAGQVIKRSITLGQAIEVATDAFHVADLSRLWVHLDVFEKDLEHVRVGERATIRTDSHPDLTFPSRVAWIEPRVDEATRTAKVRIEFENVKRALRPGQFVTAHLSGEPGENTPVVTAVPRKSVVTVEGKHYVFVEDKSAGAGSYIRRPIDLGRAGGDLVEVRAGVAEGDQVVTDGAFLLKSESQR